MKVLFLDVDGVLNSTRTVVAYGGYPMELEHIGAFDHVALMLIQSLCRQDVKICISSAWRLYNKPADFAKAFGLDVIGATPSLVGNRGKEIAAWLAKHPSVEEYAIVDDDSDMLPEQAPHFVHTSGHNGLMWENYMRLCKILGCDPHEGRPRDRNWRVAGRVLNWNETDDPGKTPSEPVEPKLIVVRVNDNGEPLIDRG